MIDFVSDGHHMLVTILIIGTIVLSTPKMTVEGLDPLHFDLVHGSVHSNSFGDFIAYYIFAEERAVISPPPQFGGFRGSNRIALVEPAPPATPEPASSDSSDANSTAPFVPRVSHMAWWAIHLPLGAPQPAGERSIAASAQGNSFLLPDLVFHLAGEYNLLFNVTMYTGEKIVFNRTIAVAKQPQVVTLSSSPTGYNGSALDPEPILQLTDWLGNIIRTSTPTLHFDVISGPEGGIAEGTTALKPDSNGFARMLNVVLSLPGTYLCEVRAVLSDNSILRTPTFQLTVLKALPTKIITLSTLEGTARFVLSKLPVFQLHDQRGIVDDPRANISLSIGFNMPSVSYQGFDTQAALHGVRVVPSVNYTFNFTDLMVDLPGRYDLTVSLLIDGELLLQESIPFQIDDPPTFEASSDMKINTIGEIRILGAQPALHPLFLKLSTQEDCLTTISDIVPWGHERPARFVRNVSFVSYGAGDNVYVCLQIPSVQNRYVPLVQHYLPRFDEFFPRILTFSIVDVTECQRLDVIRAFQYQLAGWDTATAGRAYGCALTPPVAGTIAPCECSFILKCDVMEHEMFRPANLNIGQCTCCKSWVMAVAASVTCAFLAVILSVIYYYV